MQLITLNRNMTIQDADPDKTIHQVSAFIGRFLAHAHKGLEEYSVHSIILPTPVKLAKPVVLYLKDSSIVSQQYNVAASGGGK